MNAETHFVQELVEFVPPPISAETNAKIWLSLRTEDDGWTAAEDEIYRMATIRLRADIAIAASYASEVSAT